MALGALLQHVQLCLDGLVTTAAAKSGRTAANAATTASANAARTGGVDFLDRYLQQLASGEGESGNFSTTNNAIADNGPQYSSSSPLSGEDALQLDASNQKLWEQAVLLCSGLSDRPSGYLNNNRPSSTGAGSWGSGGSNGNTAEPLLSIVRPPQDMSDEALDPSMCVYPPIVMFLLCDSEALQSASLRSIECSIDGALLCYLFHSYLLFGFFISTNAPVAGPPVSKSINQPSLHTCDTFFLTGIEFVSKKMAPDLHSTNTSNNTAADDHHNHRNPYMQQGKSSFVANEELDGAVRRLWEYFRVWQKESAGEVLAREGHTAVASMLSEGRRDVRGCLLLAFCCLL
jgi:hypothetical protein